MSVEIIKDVNRKRFDDWSRSYDRSVLQHIVFRTSHNMFLRNITPRYNDTSTKVLDVGCGTGALAIMAHKRGATDITAVDIDEWCIENSEENFTLNGCEFVKLSLGGIETVSPEDPFDIILANINKNVLLDQVGAYSQRL